MPVDSFKFLPRAIAFYYQNSDRRPKFPIPWTPLKVPVNECTFALVTSGGIYHQQNDPPFNVERERHEPVWGDPSYRIIPINISQNDIGVSHLHINTIDILEDINIILPITRFKELVAKRKIGRLYKHAFSFMGYQGFPPDTTSWEQEFGPRVAEQLLVDGVDCVFLTPA